MKSLYSVFFEGFLGGFAAFLMPCIYPMLPLTVSFFLKQTGSRSSAIRAALVYGLSIIVIYVLFGALITAVLGPSALNGLASSAGFNLFVFLLLVTFAISFFGVFEINLPSSLVNKVDEGSGAKSLLGIFLMAFTLALVSFSCTAGIIGYLMVEAVRSKSFFGLILGMSGFSVALALPFTLAALFPGLLSRLPKSGSWLNSVKVVLGFLELALSLKFFSTFDLVYHAGILGRDTFLSLWIVIFTFLGLYLLGKIKLSHDATLEHVSVPRLLFALASFAFAVYMVPGLWGAPLKILSGIAPPMETQEFSLNPVAGPNISQSQGMTQLRLPPDRLYVNLFKEPLGLEGFFDLKEAAVYSKAVKKPLFIDFTGHSCVNCRKMEQTVWVDPAVKYVLAEDYILVSLYVDERTELPAGQQYTSKQFGNKVRTIGNLNSDLQANLFNTNSQPYYVIAGEDLKPLVKPLQFDSDIGRYLAFLQSGRKAYNEKFK